MSRQINPYEKKLFEIVKEYNNRFYYYNIYKVVEGDGYKIKIEKDKEEMIGRAYVTLQNGDRIDYELRYNRIINLSDSYTLLVPNLKAEDTSADAV